MIKLGASYSEKISTSEVVQVSTEGVEQFEIYLGKYLPQFYYAMIDLLILFVIFSIMSLKIGFVLFLSVPLIPFSIMIFSKIAKKSLVDWFCLLFRI